MKTFLYYLALVLGAPFALLFFKMKVRYEGGEKFDIPKGAVIISGHKTWLDAIAIAYLFFFRRMHFLAADWYHGFRIVFKPFMSLLGAVLVDLKGERFDFLSECRSLLTSGKSLLVFPEGDYATNKRLFEFGPFKTGYLLIALESGAPIVPVVSDFSYGLFSRTHFLIGKPIYPLLPQEKDSSRDQVLELNERVRGKCLSLLHALQRESAKKIKMCYSYREPKKGDVLRIHAGLYHHYGVYFDDQHVIEFGHAVNPPGEDIDIHLTPLLSFTGGKIPEVRDVSSHRKKRSLEEIEGYAKEVLGQRGYSLGENNCLDLVNRLTLKI